MSAGAVWLHHTHGVRRLRRRSAQLHEGDELHLYYDPGVLVQRPPAARLVEDAGSWSLWVKPAGMRAQGSKWGDHTTLGRWAEAHLEPRRESFIVHRLDLAASGLMLLAHDRATAAGLSRQFAARTVGKRYLAIVHGEFTADRGGLTLSGPIDGREAHTEAWRAGFDPDARRSLLVVSIRTGRKHQIRRHLAEAGFPIVGDRLHRGMREAAADSPLRLAAVGLSFDAPDTGERVTFEQLPAGWPLAPDADTDIWGACPTRASGTE